jgi:hypothetical protein
LSSADLSVEIYRLVTRVAGGEPIDVATRSEELATRFAHLGLSAQLIGKAIARAAGMVGVAVDGIGEAPPPLTGAAHPQPAASGSLNGFHVSETPMLATRGPASQSPDLIRGSQSLAIDAAAADASGSEAPAEADRDASLRRLFIRER